MSPEISAAGRTAICTLPTGPIGEGIARGLAQRGWRLALVGMGVAPDELAAALRADGASVHAVACEFDSRAAVHDAMAEATASLGAPSLVVHGFPLYPPRIPRPLLDINEAGWTMACGSTMKAALCTFQAAFDAFAPAAATATQADPADPADPADLAGPADQRRSGRIVVVLPTFAMSGAASYVLAASAAEGIRSLVKSAARQWGRDGITVNCIAVDPSLLLDQDDAAASAVSLAVPALEAGDPADDLAPAVHWLASGDAHFVTGQTLVLDGGTWMAR